MGFRQAIIGVSRAHDWNYRTRPVATHRDRPPPRAGDRRWAALTIPRSASAGDNSPWTGGGKPNMQLTLYVRRDCHLCAEMHRDLLALESAQAFTLELVDIDSDAELVARYGHKVPVLIGEGEEICHYFLDEPQLAAYFNRPP